MRAGQKEKVRRERKGVWGYETRENREIEHARSTFETSRQREIDRSIDQEIETSRDRERDFKKIDHQKRESG